MNISTGSLAILDQIEGGMTSTLPLSEPSFKAIALSLSENTSTLSASPFMTELTIFLLACFVGYYVVWNITPALHSPLMAVTNAISSVIILGALMAAGASQGATAFFSFTALILASINIFGGFIVTQRMLQMFKKKKALSKEKK